MTPLATQFAPLLLAITFPLMVVQDDSGAVVTGATVTVASVTDKAGVAISSPGVSVNLAGANVSVDYDPAAHGEAWVTLAVSKVGSTFSGTNAAPAFYLAADSGRILAALPASGTVAASVWQDPVTSSDLTLAGSIGAFVRSLTGGSGGGTTSGVVVITGTVTASASSSNFTATLSSNAPGIAAAYVGRQVLFQSGAANQQRGVIQSVSVSGSAGSYTVQFSLNAATYPAIQTQPAAGDTFAIL